MAFIQSLPTISKKSTTKSSPPLLTCKATATATTRKQIVVIGAGAAGHLAAITIARRTDKATTRIHLLESTLKPLTKVLLSGGGRCNVTSSLDINDTRSFASNYPRGKLETLGSLCKFGAVQTMDFFRSENVQLKIEQSTRKVFPVSDKASSITNALQLAASTSGVILELNAKVIHVQLNDDGLFEVRVRDGRSWYADYVVFTTGGAKDIWNLLNGCFGLQIVQPVPSLFTFGIRNDARLIGLAGLSVNDASIQLLLASNAQQNQPHIQTSVKKTRKRKLNNHGLVQRGPILITHWGLSGPAVLALSAFGAREMYEAGYKLKCNVDWIPSETSEKTKERINWMIRNEGRKQVNSTNPFREYIPKRLWNSLITYIEVDNIRWAEISKQMSENIVKVIHGSVFDICKKGEFKEEFVTAGGVELDQIDMKTFQCKSIRGLYFAGETLNVDGKTGGYNLQFAWSSGWIAGNSIADCILSQSECD